MTAHFLGESSEDYLEAIFVIRRLRGVDVYKRQSGDS